jgi:hypothetical protein
MSLLQGVLRSTAAVDSQSVVIDIPLITSDRDDSDDDLVNVVCLLLFALPYR